MDNAEDKYNQLYDAVARMLHWQQKSETYRVTADRANYNHWRRKVMGLVKEEYKLRQSKQRELQWPDPIKKD